MQGLLCNRDPLFTPQLPLPTFWCGRRPRVVIVTVRPLYSPYSIYLSPSTTVLVLYDRHEQSIHIAHSSIEPSKRSPHPYEADGCFIFRGWRTFAVKTASSRLHARPAAPAPQSPRNSRPSQSGCNNRTRRNSECSIYDSCSILVSSQPP